MSTPLNKNTRLAPDHEREKMKHKKHKHKNRLFGFIDFIIVIVCLSVTAYSLNLFRLDLFQTINLQNVPPVGTVTIRNNIVQRRVADRALWDRLAARSPVYMGDLIRTAELSAAAIDMEGQRIDIGENTLIRIQPVTDGSGALQIELTEGSLGVAAAAEGGGLQLNLKGRTVKVSGGTTLTATAVKDELAVQVNSGTAAFIEEGGNREISPGTMITFDQEGTEKTQPAAAVTPPNVDEDSPVSSPVSFFLIEQTAAEEERAITLLEPEPEPEPPPPPPLPPPPPPPPPRAPPLPPPPLSAPANREPANNYRIGIEQIKTQRNITFKWSAVQGANAYIFTLYEQTENGRRQISRATVTAPAWTLEDISVLNRGAFIWRVEAVNRNSRNTIVRRGTTGENTFIMDIPLPHPVHIEDPGVLYDH
jgi:hypothetical protein